MTDKELEEQIKMCEAYLKSRKKGWYTSISNLYLSLIIEKFKRDDINDKKL